MTDSSLMQLLMRRPNLEGLPPLPDLPDGYTKQVMGPGEEEGVAQLLKVAFEDDGWTAERVHREFVVNEDVVKTIVVMWEGTVVATATVRFLPDLYPGCGYLHYVGVLPAHWGHGLGYYVSLAVLHEFTQYPCHDAVLETDDFRFPALKIYFKLGFVPVYRHATHSERWAAIEAALKAGR